MFISLSAKIDSSSLDCYSWHKINPQVCFQQKKTCWWKKTPAWYVNDLQWQGFRHTRWCRISVMNRITFHPPPFVSDENVGSSHASIVARWPETIISINKTYGMTRCDSHVLGKGFPLQSHSVDGIKTTKSALCSWFLRGARFSIGSPSK